MVGPTDVVVDVGAGAGRFSLPLAPRVREVVAVDVSPGMLEQLGAECARRGLDNVRCVEGSWPDVGPVAGDVVICSYVLPVVTEAAEFLRALDAATGRTAMLYLSAGSTDLLHDPLWRYFHAAPRAPAPTYLDAARLLDELGIAHSVEVVEAPVRARFASLDEAVAEYLDMLLLTDDPKVRGELQAVLADWLVSDGARWRPPVTHLPAAILSWSPPPTAGG